MNNDLISRSALLEEISKCTIRPNDLYEMGIMSGVDAIKKMVETAPAVDAVDIEKALAWLEEYSILDRHEVYTNGALLVPLFRVEQALIYKTYNGLREG